MAEQIARFMQMLANAAQLTHLLPVLLPRAHQSAGDKLHIATCTQISHSIHQPLAGRLQLQNARKMPTIRPRPKSPTCRLLLTTAAASPAINWPLVVILLLLLLRLVVVVACAEFCAPFAGSLASCRRPSCSLPLVASFASMLSTCAGLSLPLTMCKVANLLIVLGPQNSLADTMCEIRSIFFLAVYCELAAHLLLLLLLLLALHTLHSAH